MAEARPVLAFDLDSDGHHPSYLLYLAQRWLQVCPGPELVVVVGDDFLDRHPDIVGVARPGQVRFEPVTEATDYRRLPGPLAPLARGVLQWRLLARTARRLGASHAVVMYIDQMLQGPMPLQLPMPCAVSGIYFRPSFHYASQGVIETAQERRRAMRQRVTLRAALRHRRLGTLWTLDPFAVPHIQALGPGRVAALADPVPEQAPPASVVAALRARYGLDDSAPSFLLFGAISERKGVRQALLGAARVARQDGRPLTIVLVGRVSPGFEARLDAAVTTAERAGITVVRNHAFVPEAEVQAHFEAADVVLAPYQRHVGSSGIAIRAARAGKPLVASDYGMLGEVVRRRKLGVAVDARDDGALAEGIRRVLASDALPDHRGAAAFAAANTAASFADAVIATTTGDLDA